MKTESLEQVKNTALKFNLTITGTKENGNDFCILFENNFFCFQYMTLFEATRVLVSTKSSKYHNVANQVASLVNKYVDNHENTTMEAVLKYAEKAFNSLAELFDMAEGNI